MQGLGLALVRTGPDLMDWATPGPRPGPAEGGLAFEGQGQGQQTPVRAGPDRPVDSLALLAGNGFGSIRW